MSAETNENFRFQFGFAEPRPILGEAKDKRKVSAETNENFRFQFGFAEPHPVLGEAKDKRKVSAETNENFRFQFGFAEMFLAQEKRCASFPDQWNF